MPGSARVEKTGTPIRDSEVLKDPSYWLVKKGSQGTGISLISAPIVDKFNKSFDGGTGFGSAKANRSIGLNKG